ncbi:hypothetical protein PVL30_004784 [Lodderomyces elongisporus]|uniref:uncharacterized protein n=1 Tax=Lodderomyces elongisporus TaxID=36914 RepID=UPI00291CC5A8|nr:uncharacterized protein PVL30_004784 [Lodderomyces elongisporus]WLF80990.1 hypothetical protein PVL30_004784 [Lodderomyces elongisporus]
MGYLVTVLIAVVIFYAVLSVTDYFKAVPDEYLRHQSFQEPTRLPHESPIYKSSKNATLRVGLDIRYDHYKIRSGNLNDVWTILMDHVSRNSEAGSTENLIEKSISVNGVKVKYTYINHCISEWKKKKQEMQKEKEKEKNTDTVRLVESFNIPIEYEVDSKWVIVVLIGFVTQTQVHFYEKRCKKPANGLDISEMSFDEESGEDELVFENKYIPEKDKGIALKYSKQIRPGIVTQVEYTQLNIISAVASTIKHLPPAFDLLRKSMAIVSYPDFINVSNLIVKLLAGFVSNMNIEILHASSVGIETKIGSEVEILSIPEQLVNRYNFLHSSSISNKLNWQLLSQGIFKSKRLIYIQSSLESPQLTSKQRNQLAVAMKSRVIHEYGVFNILGPVVLTDYYEYRMFGASFGGVAQSLEIKLVNVDRLMAGSLMVRGYTIGKSAHFVNDKEATLQEEAVSNQFTKKSDGFMPLPLNIRGKWGTDGCLYIL